jgi:hypothetical protein
LRTKKSLLKGQKQRKPPNTAWFVPYRAEIVSV